MHNIKVLLTGLLCVLLLFSEGCERPNEKPAALAEVDVAYPLEKKISEWDEYTGRFEAVKDVELRARVSGHLNSIDFTDGQMVKVGQVLFVIDPRPFQYALSRAQAEVSLYSAQYDRAIKLQKESFIAKEAIDQRLQEKISAETHLEDAQLNLAFTSIRSPINGKIGRYLVSIGNLVEKDKTILARVVSVDPIYFYFEVTQNDFLNYMKNNPAMVLGNERRVSLPVYIKLEEDKDYLYHGTVDFVDNTVDKSTGTLLIRALVPNPDGIIYPGFFGRAKLQRSKEHSVLLLPDKAIIADQTHHFVYVLTANNEVKRAYIKLGTLRESGFYVIEDGVKKSDRVIINGMQRIRQNEQTVIPAMQLLQE